MDKYTDNNKTASKDASTSDSDQEKGVDLAQLTGKAGLGLKDASADEQALQDLTCQN